MSSDDLTQQLAEQIAWRVADVMGWPEWMRSRALGRPMTPIVKRVLDAALASGLVVPTGQWDTLAAVSGETMDKYLKLLAAVNDLAQQWEVEAANESDPSVYRTLDGCTAELRALIRQETS